MKNTDRITLDIDLLLTEMEYLFGAYEQLRKLGRVYIYPGSEGEKTYKAHQEQERAVSAMCEFINADKDKVYKLTRFYLKWMEYHDWQKCFPTEKYYRQIIDYICPSDKEKEAMEHMETMHRVIVHWAEMSRKRRGETA